jgi:hypothetical protein
VQVSFFRVARGINSMRIEDGDCWYADPDLSMEEAVYAGKYIGSMVSTPRRGRQGEGAGDRWYADPGLSTKEAVCAGKCVVAAAASDVR